MLTDFWNEHRIEEVWLSSQLLRLGMPQHLKGFKCIIIAVVLCVKHPEYLDEMTCSLYPAVAQIMHTTPSRVERAIRYVIETAWLYGDIEYQRDVFGSSVNPSKGKPTNGMFISTMYYKMRRELVVCGKRGG